MVESCTIVTLPANEMLAEIHNTKKRMPLILPRDAYEGWLGSQNDAAEAFIQPYPSSRLVAWPVSTYVNSPKNDDPRCCSPLS